MSCSWFSCAMRLGWLLGMLLSGCLSQSLQAQPQPVSATLQITPPYSVYLSDYALPGSEQMKLHLLLRDLAEPDYPVRLHLTVEGAGIRIETSPSFMPPPLTLQGGVPALLTSTDLAPYLHSRNLLFSGITLQQYEKRGSLPEGFYRFTFRVLDYRRQDIVLSNTASFMAWFVLNDPPRINAPLCGTTLKLADPQTILFQWMPGHAGSPNSMLDTEYEFTLVEIRPKGRNPNDALLSTVPLYQTTTPYTSLLYGLSEPALIPGQQYAFRVQARDIQARDLFKNQGYSEVCTFTYGEVAPLEPPEFVHVYADAQRRAQVSWQMSINPDSYRVEYRKQPGKGEEHAWFQKATTSDQVTLYDLEPATTYEVRIASMFRTFASRYTRIQTFTTPERRVIACGQAPAPHLSAETQPLITAIAGQYWQVGDFEMQLLEVRGGDGIFSGIGSVNIPYLGLQVPVQFEEVKVNQNRELVWGEVVALREDIATFQQRWEQAHPEPSEPITSGEEEKTGGENKAPVDPPAATDNITVTGTIAAVQVSETGEILVTDTDGKQTTYAQPQEAGSGEKQETLISDAAGNNYRVDKEGKVSEETGNTGNDTNPSTKDQPDPLLEKQEALIAAVLEEFEEDLEAWLRVNGKGPLDKREISALLSLPDYVPKNAEMVEGIRTYVSQIKKTSSILVKKISEDEADRTTLDKIAEKLDISQPIKPQLEEEEWKEVKTIGSTAATDEGLLHWFTEKPYWERAAYVMQEYLESQDIYERVWKECTGNDCKIWAELKLSEEATLTQEIILGSHFTPQETFDLLVFTYYVPFWEAKSAFTHGFWEAAMNWVLIQQEDGIELKQGGLIDFANMVGDMANSTYGAVYGWITREHWRTGEELAWWEHALGILDVVPGEALAKIGITALVIRIGGKTIDLAKLSQATRQFIMGARAAGLRLVVRTADEIILYGRQGTQQIGRFVNGVLQDIYWVYGGEKVLAKLAGVKYLVDNKTVEGALEVVENGGNKIGFKFPKTGNVFSNIKTPFIIDGMPDAAGQFRQLSLKVDDKVKNLRAGNFAKRTGDKINHYITQDGQYYIKHDPDTRELLLIDAKNKKYLGYAIDEADPTSGLKLVQNSIAEEFEKVISIWKRLKGLDDATEFFVKGRRIPLPSDKITIVLGKYFIEDNPFGYLTTKEVLEELGLNNLKYWELSKDLTPSTQRIHMLNLPGEAYTSINKSWWISYNAQLIYDIIANPIKYNVVILTDVVKPNGIEEVNKILKGVYAEEINALYQHFDFKIQGYFWTIESKH